uniref:Cytochrome c subunit vb n=1 Tax=Colletotrichum fructicola (strain Nara gc5) TaxID=1213859 RepID=L2FI26_COLFN
MFLQRSAIAVARRAAVAPLARRTFATSMIRRDAAPSSSSTPAKNYKTLSEVKTEDDLLGPGAKPGDIPTDLEQSTGLERLEILGKMEGVDVFDMRPLDASRKGTMENPIPISRDRPIERCPECGSVYKMEYVGPTEDAHHHGHDHHHGYEEPKTFADFVKPEYRYQ